MPRSTCAFARVPAVTSLAFLLAFAHLGACDGQSVPRERDAAAPADVRPADLAPDAPAAPRRCRAPEGAGRPTSIADVVALINVLPAPVTLPCFLESLDRPLYFTATTSVISLQPAAGMRSPRIFLLSDGLAISLVPEGMASHTLEFGQFVAATRTIKGEVAFPVVPPLLPAMPYERIINTSTTNRGGTTCRFCHPGEERSPDIDFAEAFVSGAFRPNWRTKVDLADVRAERAKCNPAMETERCAIYAALFDHGEVIAKDLPDEVPTIN